MCKSKAEGGARCYGHALAALKTARARYASDPSAENGSLLQRRWVEYASTSKGHQELTSRITALESSGAGADAVELSDLRHLVARGERVRDEAARVAAAYRESLRTVAPTPRPAAGSLAGLLGQVTSPIAPATPPAPTAQCPACGQFTAGEHLCPTADPEPTPPPEAPSTPTEPEHAALDENATWHAKSWAVRKAELETYAHALMTQGEVPLVPVTWGNAKGRWGAAYHQRLRGESHWKPTKLVFSTQLQHLDKANAEGVVRHEVAHLVAGPHAKHGPAFVAACEGLGGTVDEAGESYSMNPAEKARQEAHQMAAANWVGRCPNGHEVPKAQCPGVVRSCGRCSKSFDPNALLRWYPKKPGLKANAKLAATAARQGWDLLATHDEYQETDRD